MYPTWRTTCWTCCQKKKKKLAILIQKRGCRNNNLERGLIAETSITSNIMFTLFVQSLPEEQSCFNAITEGPARTWHCRYGHLSYVGLKLLWKRNWYILEGLRTHRGGEFTSKKVISFGNENGIQRQLITAYTPQQNGVAKRKNKTIMNMIRCTLTEKKIPKAFWAEATNSTIHVLNRSPTLAVKHMTPEETWSRHKSSVSHFIIFGCTVYVHVPNNKRTKLEDKSLKCVLLGVSEESKAYKLYDTILQEPVEM